jgi:DoxX-like family
MTELFRRWGYPDWIRITLGCIELAAATLLLWKPGRWLGTQIMIAVMGGAIATLVSHDELPGRSARWPSLAYCFCSIVWPRDPVEQVEHT